MPCRRVLLRGRRGIDERWLMWAKPFHVATGRSRPEFIHQLRNMAANGLIWAMMRSITLQRACPYAGAYFGSMASRLLCMSLNHDISWCRVIMRDDSRPLTRMSTTARMIKRPAASPTGTVVSLAYKRPSAERPKRGQLGEWRSLIVEFDRPRFQISLVSAGHRVNRPVG